MKRSKIFGNVLKVFLVFLFLSINSSYAFAQAPTKEIKIVFTGQSYSALYPCSCPVEPDGGVARRATFIKNMRKANENIVVVEAGSSLASGREDQYSQNYQLDSKRSDIYIKALNMMGYDAVLLAGHDLSFGSDFIEGRAAVPFITSNIKGYKRPYVIKDLGWIKVGILGLTDNSALTKGAEGWLPPVQIFQEKVAELKKKGVSIIILLSSLTPQEDGELLKSVKGVDVVINGGPSYGSVNLNQDNGVSYLTTWWQGRRLGVLTLKVSKANKIVNKALDSERLSSAIADDPAVSGILPKCFTDGDCKKVPGSIQKCEEGSMPAARCTYTEQPPVSLVVIIPRNCKNCRRDEVTKDIKRVFGNLKIDTLFEDGQAAKEIIKDFNITMLPAYLFRSDIEKSDNFANFTAFLEKGKNFYMLKPQVAGVSYFLNRKTLPKRLDVFFDHSAPQLSDLFKILRTFHEKHKDIALELNFLVTRGNDGNLISKGGAGEIEEFKRVACVSEYYPGEALDYLICRTAQAVSNGPDECAIQSKIDASKINACASSAKAHELLGKHIRLTGELQISAGPTFIVDNKEVFSMVNIPSLEELEDAVIGGKTKNSSKIK